jgi:hypothetical protein
MDNANIFPVLPSPTVHPREPIGGYFSYKPDVIGRRREEVQILRPPDFGVGHDAVPQYEPPGSPPLAVIGPLVEHPGHRALRSPALPADPPGNPAGKLLALHRDDDADRSPTLPPGLSSDMQHSGCISFTRILETQKIKIKTVVSHWVFHCTAQIATATANATKNELSAETERDLHGFSIIRRPC